MALAFDYINLDLCSFVEFALRPRADTTGILNEPDTSYFLYRHRPRSKEVESTGPGISFVSFFDLYTHCRISPSDLTYSNTRGQSVLPQLL